MMEELKLNLNAISPPTTYNNSPEIYNYTLDNHFPELFQETNSTNSKEKVQDIAYLSLFAVTSTVALVGNSIVCKVVFSKAHMRNFTNLLLANLAISDVSCVLMFFVGLLVCWDYFILALGQHACVIAKVIQMLSFQVSTVTMTVIAIDRFLLVYYPLVRKHRRIPVQFLMLFVWLVSFAVIVITSPTYAFHRFFTTPNPAGSFIQCEVREVFPHHALSANDLRVRLILANVGYFWVPLTVIAVCYGSIALKVMQRNVGTMTPSQQEILLRKKWKTIKMLIVSVAVFFLSWFPFITLNLFDILTHPEANRDELCNKSGVLGISLWLVYTSCCHNPFVYWIYSEDFRGGLKEVWNSLKSFLRWTSSGCGCFHAPLESNLTLDSYAKSSSQSVKNFSRKSSNLSSSA